MILLSPIGLLDPVLCENKECRPIITIVAIMNGIRKWKVKN